MKRMGCVVIVLVIVAGLGFAAWWRVKGRQQQARGTTATAAVPVDVQRVEKGDLAPSVEVTGTIVADDKVAISAKMSGRVDMVAAREGERVRASQVVVRLDGRDVAAQVAQAKAALEMAQVRLAQAETAAQLQTTRSGTDVASAQAALAQAEAQLAVLRSGARPQERKQAEYAVQQAKAALDNAATEYGRMQDLYRQGAVSKQSLDVARLQYDVAKSQHDSAQQQLSLVRAGARQEDIDAAEQSVRRAREALRLAEAATAQIEMSGQDVQAAHAAVAQARAGLQAAQVQADNTVVRTPISGVTAERSIEPGEMAVAGVALLTVVSNDAVYLRAELPERELRRVRVGDTAAVTVDAASETPIEARVAEILPAANEDSLTFTVKVAVPNADGLLKDGMFGRARVAVERERRHDVVVIPQYALVEQATGTVVFVVEGSKAAAVPVELGLSVGGQVEVVSGLRGGEQLVVRGQGSLQGGETVAVQSGA